MQGILLGEDADIVTHPSDKLRRVFLELFCGDLVKCVLQLHLEWGCDHLILYSLCELIATSVECILKDGHRHVTHILIIQALEYTDGAIHVVGVFVDKL